MTKLNFIKLLILLLFFSFSNLQAETSYEETKKYSKVKKEQLYKRGEKIYKTTCSDIDSKSFNSFSDLMHNVKENNLCNNQNEKNLIAVSLYLWDIKYLDKKLVKKENLLVPKNSRCPVCGMFVHKYPKWATKINIGEHIHYFDGVKDMMKYYFNPSSFGDKHSFKDIKEMRVSDYYTFEMIDAKKAWYVEGSNVYGPMGNELIPFKNKDDAKTFLKNHYGKKLLDFEKITKKIIFGLDK